MEGQAGSDRGGVAKVLWRFRFARGETRRSEVCDVLFKGQSTEDRRSCPALSLSLSLFSSFSFLYLSVGSSALKSLRGASSKAGMMRLAHALGSNGGIRVSTGAQEVRKDGQ